MKISKTITIEFSSRDRSEAPFTREYTSEVEADFHSITVDNALTHDCHVQARKDFNVRVYAIHTYQPEERYIDPDSAA